MDCGVEIQAKNKVTASRIDHKALSAALQERKMTCADQFRSHQKFRFTSDEGFHNI
jgi:hypothetical protein